MRNVTEPSETLSEFLNVVDRVLQVNKVVAPLLVESTFQVTELYASHQSKYTPEAKAALSKPIPSLKSGDQWADPFATRLIYLNLVVTEDEMEDGITTIANFCNELAANDWLKGVMAPLSSIKLHLPTLDHRTGHVAHHTSFNNECVACGHIQPYYSLSSAWPIPVVYCPKLGENFPKPSFGLISYIHVPTRLHEAIRDASAGLVATEGAMNMKYANYVPSGGSFSAHVHNFNKRYT